MDSIRSIKTSFAEGAGGIYTACYSANYSAKRTLRFYQTIGMLTLTKRENPLPDLFQRRDRWVNANFSTFCAIFIKDFEQVIVISQLWFYLQMCAE